MRNYYILSFILFFLFPACRKSEGFGGRATVTGKVIVQEYNYDFSILKETYEAQAEDVYIIFGNDTLFSEKTETHFDGYFRFEYLQKGTYTIFVYSDDKSGSSPSGKIPTSIEVNITKAGETVDVGDIIIYKSVKDNSGTSSVTGKVYVLDYNADYTYIQSEYYAPEENVYLIYGDEASYMDRVRTNYDGTYVFKDLPIGTYKVYAYSEDTTGSVPGGIYPVFQSFTISEGNQHITVNDIVINK